MKNHSRLCVVNCVYLNGKQVPTGVSPDVILCGWLGSKHQLANSYRWVKETITNVVTPNDKPWVYWLLLFPCMEDGTQNIQNVWKWLCCTIFVIRMCFSLCCFLYLSRKKHKTTHVLLDNIHIHTHTHAYTQSADHTCFEAFFTIMFSSISTTALKPKFTWSDSIKLNKYTIKWVSQILLNTTPPPFPKHITWKNITKHCPASKTYLHYHSAKVFYSDV